MKTESGLPTADATYGRESESGSGSGARAKTVGVRDAIAMTTKNCKTENKKIKHLYQKIKKWKASECE